MRIGKLFALSMLTVTVFAVILGAEVLIPQARIFTNRSDAIKTVDAFGATLMVSQHVAGFPDLPGEFCDAGPDRRRRKGRESGRCRIRGGKARHHGAG
jgi:hypothetical protein